MGISQGCPLEDIYILQIFGKNPFVITCQSAKLDKMSNLSNYNIINDYIPYARVKGYTPREKPEEI